MTSLHAAVLMRWEPRRVVTLEPRTIARAPWRDGEATILLAGDTAEIDAALPTLAEQGLLWPFQLTMDLVRDADLAIVNHEAPITDGGRRFPIWKDWIYRAPSASAGALAFAGVDVLGLANNHLLDYGAEGLRDTIAHAEAAGLVTAGAGESPEEARRGVIATLGALRVGVLAYCEKQILWRTYVDLYARPGHPGVAALVERDLADDIARLRPRVDVLIVSLHVGLNYAPPTADAVRWSQRAVELGADLVVGHHPHVAHPVAVHQGKPILLSLGNYTFGTPGWSILEHGWLALAHVTGRRLDRVELVPLDVQNRRVRFRPVPLDGAALDAALRRMQAESAAFGARLRIDRGRAILDLDAP